MTYPMSHSGRARIQTLEVWLKPVLLTTTQCYSTDLKEGIQRKISLTKGKQGGEEIALKEY